MLAIIILCFLLFFSAILSASETSLFSLSSYTLKTYLVNPDTRKKLVAHLLKKPRDLLVTILMLNIFFNILVQNTVSSIFGNLTSWVLKVGVPLVLTLVFGEVLPKTIALQNNKRVAYAVSPYISVAMRLIKPIRALFVKITEVLSHVFFFFLKKEKPLSSPELSMIVSSSKEKGVLSAQEAKMIQGYLEIHDSFVKEKMRPREEIIFYDIQNPLKLLVSIFQKQQCTRVPICDRELNNCLGILSADHFFLHGPKIIKPEDIKNYLSAPYFVPDTKNAWHLLCQMREKNEDMAIVVDEYGTISGLITQEDIIEEIVGEITDVRDVTSHYTRSSKDVIIASGKMELDEVEEVFKTNFASKSTAVTLSGWLIDQFEEIPQAGMKLIANGFLFYILSAEPNRIKRVYIRKLHTKKEGA
jgi:CBS domain containing-hemolysin-like protein